MIGLSAGQEWNLEADGLRRTDEAMMENGVVVKPMELMPLDNVKALAMRQPPYEAGWVNGFSLDPANPPVPSIVSISGEARSRGRVVALRFTKP